MSSRTATLRLQLIDSVQGPAKGVVSSLNGVDGALARLGKRGTPEVRRLTKQFEYLQKKAASMSQFTASRRSLKAISSELRAAQSNVGRLQKILQTAPRKTQKMQQDIVAAKKALAATTATFKEQGAAVRGAEQALRRYGINGRAAIGGAQKSIRNEIASTIREMRRLDQEARKSKPPRRLPPAERAVGGSSVAYETAVAIGGGTIASAGRRVFERSFMENIEFDRVAAYQGALGSFTPEDRKALNTQAEKIGGDTRFSNPDVVEAQTRILQGGIRDPKIIMDLTEKVTDYALAMGTTLEEAAETVRGAASSKRINLGDAKEIGKFVDNLVWMAKNGGMNDEDVRQFMKYGGASTTAAGLPDDYMQTIGMVLRRSGMRGDEAGVFARSMSAKLVAPTQKGRTALAAMGIDFNDFVTMPERLNERGIEVMMKERFQARLTDEMRKQVSDLMVEEFADPETGEMRSVLSDAGEFSARMGEILGPLFMDKKGKMAASDADKLGSALRDFHKFSAESVDSVGIFNAIMNKDPSLISSNAFFTDKQGGRAASIAQQWPAFLQLLDTMRNTPAGIANKIGVEANSGIYGDWTKLTGTVETAMLKIGQDWEFASRPLINKTNEVIDGFIGLSENTRRLIEAFGAAIAVAGGVAAFRAGTGLLGRFLPGGATGAAAGNAVTGAAAAAGGASLSARVASLLSKFALPLAAATTLGRGSIVDDEKLKAKLKASLPGPTPGQTVAREINKQKVADLQSETRSATVAWPFAAQQGMREYTAALQQGGDQAEAEAARIAEDIEAHLNIVANPDVNTGRLERALAIARQLAAALRGEALGGGSAPSGSTDPASNNTLKFGGPRAKGGPVKRGVTYPVGGSGIELFTPNQDGQITPAAEISSYGQSPVILHLTQRLEINGSSAADLRKIAADAANEAVAALNEALGTKLSRSNQTAFSGMNYKGA